MKKDVSQLTDEERSRLFPVILQKHNPHWKNWYLKEKRNILKNVDDIGAIYHYGSTSIPNIIAKPIIDILIEIDRIVDLETFKKSFLNLGYHYMGFGKEPSIMFVKGYKATGFAKRVFHVHIYYIEIQDELLFRDYLIDHPNLAKEYEKLKLSLKDKYEYDRDGYTFAKSNFMAKITKTAVNEHKKPKA